MSHTTRLRYFREVFVYRCPRSRLSSILKRKLSSCLESVSVVRCKGGGRLVLKEVRGRIGTAVTDNKVERHSHDYDVTPQGEQKERRCVLCAQALASPDAASSSHRSHRSSNEASMTGKSFRTAFGDSAWLKTRLTLECASGCLARSPIALGPANVTVRSSQIVVMSRRGEQARDRERAEGCLKNHEHMTKNKCLQ